MNSKIYLANKLENTIIISILLVVYKLVIPINTSLIPFIINELLVFGVLYFLFNYVNTIVETKKETPLSLVLNTGILGALIFFVISVSNALLGKSVQDSVQSNFFNSLIFIAIDFVFVIVAIYIFSTFRTLFFLRQVKDQSIYFNTMLAFFSLTFISDLNPVNASYDYIHDAFYVVSIVLICLNSLKVSWIAFLTKKQKVYLLVISIILSILFGLNFSLLTENAPAKILLFNFSSGFYSIYSLVMIYGMIYFGIIFFTTLFHLPTAAAFDRKSEEVSSLMDLTKLITQVFDFKELADTITSITTKVCNSYSAWLITIKENNYELNSVKNIAYVDADNITKVTLQKIKLIDDVQILDYSYLNQLFQETPIEYKSIAIAPLKVHGNINGYLFAARKHEINFDEEDKRSIQAFAYYAAVALENAKLIAQSIEKERLEKELDVARDVQRKILPHKIPSSSELEISALFIPAFEVGGDYYDFFELDENNLGFAVADVSGKGITAAFIMAEIKGIFESLSKIIFEPREMLIKINDILKKSLDKKSFITAVYGIIDKKNGILNFVRAGHPPAIYCSQNKTERLLPSGIGLGLDYANVFGNTLKEMQIKLKDGDIVAFYSDGIPEAKNAEYKDYGYDRFESIIQKNCCKSIDEISNEIIKDLTLFSKDNTQHDDITLVLFRWNSNKK
ncbi:GAF domain-containing SpoIIE family protein phosphatase [Rosettibacter firmus]|uniref:GAF domain-containing SpoIIE family protein phosphatase n=1 Tax=Rosettibacter firmus TaxID=3111522 RepID=UPI00336BC478